MERRLTNMKEVNEFLSHSFLFNQNLVLEKAQKALFVNEAITL